MIKKTNERFANMKRVFTDIEWRVIAIESVMLCGTEKYIEASKKYSLT